MKSLKSQVSESIVNEARQVEYYVTPLDVQDSEGIPVTVKIVVDKEYQKQFEAWLNKEEGNIFSHAEGGNVEY